jgi:tetratricopeptide (TPR) repeat protein
MSETNKMRFTLSTLLILFFACAAFAQAELGKGIEFYQQGKYDEAVAVLQKAVEANKNERDTWFLMGMSYIRLKKTEEALKAFEQGKAVKFKDYLPPYDSDLKIKRKPRPSYTDEARRNKIVGVVRMAVEFGADGKINFQFPIKTLEDGLTEATAEAIRKIDFEPAIKNGKPVPVVRILEYSFSIY